MLLLRLILMIFIINPLYGPLENSMGTKKRFSKTFTFQKNKAVNGRDFAILLSDKLINTQIRTKVT